METKKKGEHLLVVYSKTGEHIMIEYDHLAEDLDRGRIGISRTESDEDGHMVQRRIAVFYRENIAGWEQLR